jgi:hypothetical protein
MNVRQQHFSRKRLAMYSGPALNRGNAVVVNLIGRLTISNLDFPSTTGSGFDQLGLWPAPRRHIAADAPSCCGRLIKQGSKMSRFRIEAHILG